MKEILLNWHTIIQLLRGQNDLMTRRSSAAAFSLPRGVFPSGLVISAPVHWDATAAVQYRWVFSSPTVSSLSENVTRFMNKLDNFLHHAVYTGKAALTLCSVKLQLTF